MNFGVNSNVRIGEALYHVQTEDRGPSHPFLDTVVYEAGRVIYKKSTSYEELTGYAMTESISKKLHLRCSVGSAPLCVREKTDRATSRRR